MVFFPPEAEEHETIIPAAGFSGLSYFLKLFKRRGGLSLRQDRRKHGKSVRAENADAVRAVPHALTAD